MGYLFKLYDRKNEEGKTDKSSFIPYVPNNFKEENISELVYFDYLTLLMGNKDSFLYKLRKDKPVYKNKKVLEIKVSLKEGKRFHEYNVVFENPYLSMLLEVEDNKFKYINANSDSKKKVDKMSVRENTKPFKEMSDYIFESLKDKEKKKVLLNKIYKYDNPLRKALKEYANIYPSIDQSYQEEIKLLHEKEDKIIKKLKVYKYFRTMATSRYKYELEEEKKKILEEEVKKAKEEEEYKQAFEDYRKFVEEEFKDIKLDKEKEEENKGKKRR